MIEGKAAVLFNDVEFLVGGGGTEATFLFHIRTNLYEIEIGDE